MEEYALDKELYALLTEFANYIQENPNKSLKFVRNLYKDKVEHDLITQFYYVFGGMQKYKENYDEYIKKLRILIYFMFTNNLDAVPNPRIIGENWYKRLYYLKPNKIVKMVYNNDMQPFEIYIIRRKQIPPPFYFDKIEGYKDYYNFS